MGHATHIVRIQTPDIDSAISASWRMMKAKADGDNTPQMRGYFCPSTGEKQMYLNILGETPSEEDVLKVARLVRFQTVFAGIPKGIAPWRTTNLVDETEDKDFLVWKEEQIDNQAEELRFAETVTSMADERKYALPLVKVWTEAIANGDDQVVNNSHLKSMIEKVAGTQMSSVYPFVYGGNLYENRCHACHTRYEEPVVTVYVFFSVHI